jgi:ankyrin repeat protein
MNSEEKKEYEYDYIKLAKYVIKSKNYDKLREINLYSRDLENKFRELFVTKRDSKLLENQHITLISIYQHYDIFKSIPLTKIEQEIPTLFDHNISNQRVVDQQTFKNNFNIFTENQLSLINWDNIFVAGGAVLGSLFDIPQYQHINNQENAQYTRDYYHNKMYKGSDIDLFIYGLNEEDATEKIKEIYKAIQQFNPHNVICFRSVNTITLVSQYPYRHIQIILRLYKSPAEILMGFDVDSCSVGFDGTNAWTTPRGHYSIVKMRNIVDMERRSPSYEYRLYKYGERGFSVEVNNLDVDSIDPEIYKKKIHKINGLGRLLILSKLGNNKKNFEQIQRDMKMRPSKKKNNELINIINRVYKGSYNIDSMNLDEDLSDYSTVFLPWGPKWTAEEIANLVVLKDKTLNSPDYDNKKFPTHPCFIGTMDEVIKDCSVDKYDIEKSNMSQELKKELQDKYVYGKLKWKIISPGEQKIGSFHPITDEDWINGIYVVDNINLLHEAIIKNNVEEVKRLIDYGVDLNRKDFLGRSPLHLCVLYNSVESCKLLLGFGLDACIKAHISYKLNDGRTIFHLACEYGNLEIAKIVYEYGIKLDRIYINSDKDEKEIDFTNLSELTQYHKERKERLTSTYDEIAMNGKKESMSYFDPNEADWDFKLTPLFYTVLFDHNNIFELLINQDEVNIKEVRWKISDVCGYKNEYGCDQKEYDLLELCFMLDRKDIIKTLLTKFDLLIFENDVIDGKTTIHRCLKYANIYYLDMLIKYGYKINVFSRYQHYLKTPLTVILEKLSHEPENTNLKNILVYILNLKETKTTYIEKDIPDSRTLMVKGILNYSWNNLIDCVQQPIEICLHIHNYWILNTLITIDETLINYIIKGKYGMNLKYYTPYDYILSEMDRCIENLKTLNNKLIVVQSSSNFVDDELKYKNGYNLLSKDIKNINESIENTTDKLYTLRRIEKLLIDKGGKKLIDLNLCYNQNEELTKFITTLKEKKTQITNSINKPIEFYSLNHDDENKYNIASIYYCHKRKNRINYTNFFDGIWKNNVQNVIKSCFNIIPDNITYVCTFSSITKRSPLHIAIMQNNVNMLITLMKIAHQQYTPLTYIKPTEKNEYIPIINNLQLAEIAKKLEFNVSADVRDEPKIINPNIDINNLKCIINPSHMLQMKTKDGNLMKNIIKYKAFNCFYSMIDNPTLFDRSTLIEVAIKKINIENEYVTPYEWALNSSNIEFSTKLIELGVYNKDNNDINNYTLLKSTTYKTININDNKKEISKILNVGYNGAPESILFLSKHAKSILNKDHIDFDINSVDDNGNNIVHYICKNTNDHGEQVEKWLDCIRLVKKISPELLNKKNNNGETPAFLATKCKSFLILQKLLEFEIDSNVINNEGENIIHYISKYGTVAMIDVVLRYNIKLLNKPILNKGSTPLNFAIKYKNIDVAKHLINREADYSIVDVYGNSPHHYAAINSDIDLFKKLILVDKACLEKENNFGLTPQDYIKQKLKIILCGGDRTKDEQIINYYSMCNSEIRSIHESYKYRCRSNLNQINSAYNFIFNEYKHN